MVYWVNFDLKYLGSYLSDRRLLYAFEWSAPALSKTLPTFVISTIIKWKFYLLGLN